MELYSFGPTPTQSMTLLLHLDNLDGIRGGSITGIPPLNVAVASSSFKKSYRCDCI